MFTPLTGRQGATLPRVRRKPVRLPCAAGEVRVADVTPLGLELFHPPTQETLCLSWEELIGRAAEVCDMTEREFVELLQQIAPAPRPEPPLLRSAGPSDRREYSRVPTAAPFAPAARNGSR